MTAEEILAVAGKRVTSEHSRRAYRAGLAAPVALLASGSGLAPATINLRLAAVRSALRLAPGRSRRVGTPRVGGVAPRDPGPADVRRLGEAAGRQDTL